MNKKTFLICFFITILAVGMAFFVISQKNLTTQETPLGNFVFEKTNQEGTEINKIIFKQPKLQISLYYENKFWHVKEADGYFADLVTVNKLFQDINTAKIEGMATDISPLEAGLDLSDKQGGVEIQTYNRQGKLLDSVIIGRSKNSFLYAKFSNEPQIYLISGDFELPDKLRYWLQQPLISLSPENVESVILQNKTGQQIAYRLSPRSEFYDLRQRPINLIPLLDKFVLLTFSDVKQLQNTPLGSLKPDKIIALFPYSGLIYGIEIYQIDEDFWIKVDLSITKLPTKFASDYIKDSLFLYQNWGFKIDKNLGQYLLKYKIN